MNWCKGISRESSTTYTFTPIHACYFLVTGQITLENKIFQNLMTEFLLECTRFLSADKFLRTTFGSLR
jgi:hypothetical protein